MNKKMTKQTVVIIILTILLLLALCFGGVYAYYSSSTSRTAGSILFANLKINFDDNSWQTGTSETVWFSENNVVPNQSLKNTPLKIINDSNTLIYIVLFYTVKTTNLATGEVVEDAFNSPVLAINTPGWQYHCYSSNKGEQPLTIRAMVTTTPQSAQEITVVEANELRTDRLLGNEFQNCKLDFSFKAYAISANSFEYFNESTPVEQKCQDIIDAIYESHFYELNI